MNTTTAAPAQAKEPLGAKRLLLLVFGGLTVLLALALLASAGGALWGLSQRDKGGYFMSGTHELSTSTYAFASESLDIGPEIPGWLEDGFATIRVEATSAKPVFIGVGRVADVERYLADVEHAQITDFDIDPFAVSYRELGGTAQPAVPGKESFWRAQAIGSGEQTVTWPIEEGTWSVVAMNADGSRNVSVDARVGTHVDYLGWITVGLLVVGVLILIGGAWLVYAGARRPRRALLAA